MAERLLDRVYAAKDSRDLWRSVAVCLASQIVVRDLTDPVRRSLSEIADGIETRAARHAMDGYTSLAALLRAEAGRYREAVTLIDSLTTPQAHTTDR